MLRPRKSCNQCFKLYSQCLKLSLRRFLNTGVAKSVPALIFYAIADWVRPSKYGTDKMNRKNLGPLVVIYVYNTPNFFLRFLFLLLIVS